MVAEADEFAVDASVTPGRVLLCQSDDELADLGGGWGTSGASLSLGPVTGYALAVPAQQGVGGDDPTVRWGRGSAAAIAPSRLRSSSLCAGRLTWR